MSELGAGLRDRLIDVGAELVASEGTAAVSLREIARRAGVSHGAPRRYSRRTVSCCRPRAAGFAALAARLSEAAADNAQGPRAQLAALSRAYLEFAASNRGMYELMFRHDLLESNRLGLREVSLPLFSMVTALVAAARPRADGAPAVASSAAPAVVAGALWANLHGIAQLWEWGSLQLATGLTDPGPLLQSVLEAHLGR